jgi:hypothetical protein
MKLVLTVYLCALLEDILGRVRALDSGLWRLKGNELIEKVLDMSNGLEHWNALKAVLERERKQELVIIIDGQDRDYYTMSKFIRKVFAYFIHLQRRQASKVIALLTNPPDDEIKMLLNGILYIEYDKERQGSNTLPSSF